jgi:hypothetical protein
MLQVQIHHTVITAIFSLFHYTFSLLTLISFSSPYVRTTKRLKWWHAGREHKLHRISTCIIQIQLQIKYFEHVTRKRHSILTCLIHSSYQALQSYEVAVNSATCSHKNPFPLYSSPPNRLFVYSKYPLAFYNPSFHPPTYLEPRAYLPILTTKHPCANSCSRPFIQLSTLVTKNLVTNPCGRREWR